MSNSIEATNSQTALIVPIHVDAFCVGSKNVCTNPEFFAGQTTKYFKFDINSAGTDYLDKYFWSDLSIELDRTPSNPLQRGIHLHWALPDALTNASVNEDGHLEFPIVPNRWLVVRHLLGEKVEVNAWVVESDYIWQEDPKNLSTPPSSIRNYQDASRVPGAFLGRAIPLEKYSNPKEGDLYLRDNEGKSGLSAVASGSISFASYYPDCQSVFGFHDSLEGIDTAKITYSIIGWFSDKTEDPLFSCTEKSKIEEAYKWSFSSDSAQPTFSLYTGSVLGIDWNDKTFSSQSAAKPIPADISIGNHPIEALSAYLHNQNLSHAGQLYETLLHSVQLGDDAGLQAKPDFIKELNEKAHRDGFSRYSGGTSYTIFMSTEDGQQEEVRDLSVDLTADLRKLNEAQFEVDRVDAYLKSAQSQLFVDWRSLFLENSIADQYVSSRIQAIKGIKNTLAVKTMERNSLWQKVKGKLVEEKQFLTEKPATEYKQPNEPVVALAVDNENKKDLLFPERYGKDGRFSEKGYLECRLSSEIMKSESTHSPEGVGNMENAQLLSQLVEEFFLLSSSTLDEVKSKTPSTSFTPPSPIALTPWEGQNPWHPLFLFWEVSMSPYFLTLKDGKFQNYEKNFFENNFPLNIKNEGFIDLNSIQLDLLGRVENFIADYKGRSILSPRPKEALENGLSTYLENNCDDEELKDLKKKLEDLEILVQPLSGFNDALLMRHQSMQIKPSAMRFSHENKELIEEIIENIGEMTGLGVSYESLFNPMRAGAIKLDFVLVDIFGQKRKIIPKGDDLICAQSMKRDLPAGTAYLAPRLMQPSRVAFEWVGKGQPIHVEEMNSPGLINPICGWILPDYLKSEFFIYDADGQALLILPTEGDPRVFPGKNPQSDMDPLLSECIQQIQTQKIQKTLIESMRKRSGKIHYSLDSSKGTLGQLIGNPIALVQADVRLEIEGMPAQNQNIEIYQNPKNPHAHHYRQSAHDVDKIDFPFQIGDFDRVGDGLVGYFLQGSSGDYDYTKFYSGVGNDSSKSSLLQLNPCFSHDLKAAKKILMFVDPRAPVHIISGILPTEKLALDSRWTQQALEKLELAFFLSPLLKTRQGLQLQFPDQEGVSLSYMMENSDGSWIKEGIPPSVTEVFSAFSSQSIVEGWLHLMKEEK